MRGLRWGSGFAAALAVGLAAPAVGLAAPAAGAQGQGQGEEPGRAHPAGDWPFAGGDWSSSRHSTLADVTLDNVDRLARRLIDRGGAPRLGLARQAG